MLQGYHRLKDWELSLIQCIYMDNIFYKDLLGCKVVSHAYSFYYSVGLSFKGISLIYSFYSSLGWFFKGVSHVQPIIF